MTRTAPTPLTAEQRARIDALSSRAVTGKSLAETLAEIHERMGHHPSHAARWRERAARQNAKQEAR